MTKGKKTPEELSDTNLDKVQGGNSNQIQSKNAEQPTSEYASVSNVMKNRTDTAKNSIRNIN